MEINRLLLGVVVALNLLRFIGIESAPPGFYVDEAVGAAHVLCVKESGADFYNVSTPLFSVAAGGGYTTAPFLYGEAVWTAIFGNSVGAFRTFNAFITALTVLFLFLWVRRRAGSRVALIAALLGSVSPWAFQFSRIAWDPPLAPFFLFAGLAAFDLMSLKRWRILLGALCFAMCAYSYPPSRIQATLFLFFIPGLAWAETLMALGIYLVSISPLIFRTLFDPAFTGRSKMLGIWSSYPMNPYANDGFFGQAWGVIVQTALHFDPQFLLFSGDRNLRHSTQAVGMLSWTEFFLILIGFGWGMWALIRRQKFLNATEKGLCVFAWLGIFTGILPAALTWESVPHSLRAIGAWPFFAILAAVFGERLIRAWKRAQTVIVASALIFASFYFYEFFVNYPGNSIGWFKTEVNPIAQAYDRMTRDGASCESLRR